VGKQAELESLTDISDGLKILSPGNPATITGREVQLVLLVPVSKEPKISEFGVIFKAANSDQPISLRAYKLETLGVSGNTRRLGLVVDLEEILPTAQALSGLLWLEWGSESFKALSSNSINISIEPESDWRKAKGGFFSPATGLIGGTLLPVSAWAIKGEESAERALFCLNDREIAELHCSLPSPELAQNLPSFSSSRSCRIAGVLSTKDLGKLALKRSLEPSIRVIFPSGEETFGGRNFIWRTESSPYQSEIEYIGYSVNGGAVVRGWVLTPELKPPLLVGRSHRVSRELSDRAPGVSLKWFDREDLSWLAPASSFRTNLGFELSIEPEVFGDAPGMIELGAIASSGHIPLGSASNWLRLGRVLDRFSSGSALKSFTKGVVNSLSLAASRKSSNFGLGQERPVGKPEGRSVLFCSHNLNPCEGAPRVLAEVVRAYAAREGSDNIKIVSAQDGELRRKLEAEGIKVEVVPELQNRPGCWSEYIFGLEQASSILEEFKPARVFANTSDCYWAVRLANIFQIPSVWTIHESSPPENFGALLDSRQRLHFFTALKEATQTVFVSKASREVFSRWLGDKKSRVVPNGLDIKALAETKLKFSRANSRKKFGLNEKDFVVLSLGTITPRKGQDVVLEAARELLVEKGERNFLFFFVGGRQGEFLDGLVRRTREWGIEERVRFFEETSEVAEFYQASDAVVIASREESAPLVSLEAMAWGKPLVSTSVFGLAEQLSDGETALLFDSEDSASLADGLLRVSSDGSLRQLLSSQAEAEVIERFDLEKTVEDYLELLSNS